MALQSRVWLNGHWTTRTMDIHHILAQNREEIHIREPTEQHDVSQPPAAGIFTKTLLKSPIINWIIPARIRHKDRDDVLFLAQDYIEIKELRNGRLETLATKFEFDATIISARVFGEAMEPTDKRGNFTEIPNPSTNLGLYTNMKEQLSFKKAHHGRLERIPPNILVMALDSAVLLFLFACQSDEQIRYITHSKQLPFEGSRMKQLGKHIAVDPESRALAVAALEGHFYLYTLKSIDQLRSEVETDEGINDDAFVPVSAVSQCYWCDIDRAHALTSDSRKERRVDVDGIIMRMEFLYPPKLRSKARANAGEYNQLLLLLVVSQNGKTRLQRYEWDCSDHLRDARIVLLAQPVPPSESHPLLVIPLTLSTGVMLVCETLVTVYTDFLIGPAKREELPFRAKEDPEHPGSSRRLPLWTQWARPIRGGEQREKCDGVYICREDGIVRWFEANEAADGLRFQEYRVCRMKCNVDTAFATIKDPGNRKVDLGQDLLLCCGGQSDGGVFIIRGSEDVFKTQTIRNWAPTLDFISTENFSPATKLSSQLHMKQKEALLPQRNLVCSDGGAKYGAISELHLGIEALMEARAGLDSGILDLWVLPATEDTGIYIVISYPETTLLLQIKQDLTVPTDNQMEIESLDENFGMILDEKTLAVRRAKKGVIIQVTESFIRALRPFNVQYSFERRCRSGKLAVTDICTQRSVVALAVRQEGNVILSLEEFTSTGNDLDLIGAPISLSVDPSCISLQEIEHHLYVFLGTLSGNVMIFLEDHDEGLIQLSEYRFEGNTSICDSITLVPEQVNEELNGEALVLCGLRNGSIEMLRVKLKGRPEVHAIVSVGSSTIGSTSVKVMPSRGLYNRALISCGQDIYRLDYLSRTNEWALHRILLTEQNNPAFQQEGISVIAQVDTVRDGKEINGWNAPDTAAKSLMIKDEEVIENDIRVPSTFFTEALYCISGNQLLVASFDTYSKPVTVARRVNVDGSVNRLIFSKALNLFVVGSSLILLERTLSQSLRPSPRLCRIIRPNLVFLSADGISVVPSECAANTWVSGEKILGLFDWSLSSEKKSYHLLVVHTIIGRATSASARGRLLFLRATQGDGCIKVSRKWHRDCGKPVFSVVSYGSSSLLYCYGNILVFETLDVAAKCFDFELTLQHTLRSPARSISVKEPYVYVTTARDSLLVFKIDLNPGKRGFYPQYSDQVARDGLHHLKLPHCEIILASDKAGSVVGLWQPPENRIDGSLSTIFIAELPRSTNRLRLAPTIASSGAATILGSATDGTLYQFTILSESEWKLLSLIQELVMKNYHIRTIPHISMYNRRVRQPEPSNINKRAKHIDGDILARLLNQGGSDLLREMLSDAPKRDLDNFKTAQEQKRLLALLKDALNIELTENPAELAISYVKKMLQHAI